MGAPVGFIYTQNYSQYDFGEGHPLTPLRIELTFSLMKRYGLLENGNVKLLTPRIDTEEEVLQIHKKHYVDKLKELSKIPNSFYMAVPEYGLGPGDNPIFPNMYDAAMAVCGASLTAADYLLEQDHNRVFNILGGLHHAMPDMASGFCILNDAAVAIQHLINKKPGSRVMYLDIDCHHGDGVQWIFYDRDDVLTLSFHQDGHTLFPGTGFTKEIGKGKGEGFSLNVPMLPRTTDMIYINTFNRIVPAVMEAYRPDYLVCQLGVDTHFTDPLTQMGLSTTGHEKIFKTITELVPQSCNDKFLALGGGGYALDVVARSWTMFLAHLANKTVSEPLPEEWIEELQKKWNEQPPPTELRDKNIYLEERLLKDPYFADEIEAHSDKVVHTFETELIPRIKEKRK